MNYHSETGGRDGLVGEVLKYGGVGMVANSLLNLFGMKKPCLSSGGRG